MSLIPIKNLVDPTLDEMSKKNSEHLENLLIALLRIRSNGIENLEDFIELLKRIEKQDPDLYIYHSYIAYLEEKNNKDLSDDLYHFLELKGFGEKELSQLSINKSYREGAFINRYSNKNTHFFQMCIFYLFKTRYSRKFFWEKLDYLSKEEKKLLSDYRSLDSKTQDIISKHMDNIAKESVKILSKN